MMSGATGYLTVMPVRPAHAPFSMASASLPCLSHERFVEFASPADESDDVRGIGGGANASRAVLFCLPVRRELYRM